MKKNEKFLEYVEKYKYKYGISNLSDNSRLLNSLTVCAGVIWCYAFFMTMIFILGTIGELSFGAAEFDFIKNSFISIISGTVLMIGGAVLLCCKQKLAASVVTIISQPIIVVAFSHLMKDPAGSLRFSFYWRHAVPGILLVVFSLLVLIVLINGIVKDNKLYNTLVDALYKQYGTQNGEKLSEEQWQEFLNNYDPKKINSIVVDDVNN